MFEGDVETEATLRSILKSAGYVVQVESDGTGLERLVQRFMPDLAVLETTLPHGPNGYEVAASIGRLVPGIPLLFLTGAGSLADRLAGFEAGADDYLIKPFPPEELTARVKALLRRSGRLSSKALAAGDLLVDQSARRVVRSGAPIELTSTEFELLNLFVRSPGRVFPKSQLLGNVWGPDASDLNLVETRISSLRRKLETHGPRIIQTRHGAGYVLIPWFRDGPSSQEG